MAQTEIKQKVEPRFIVSFPVQAEWNEEKTGRLVTTEGATEFVGPTSAVVHLQQLPTVGSRITITIDAADGQRVEAKAEVLRLVRDAQQPLASLNLLSGKKEWRGKVWSQAGIVAARASSGEGYED
jgi:hypothetical protein